jgi:hypothetical protein
VRKAFYWSFLFFGSPGESLEEIQKMPNLNFKPEPSPFKETLRKHKICVSHLAAYLDLNYPYLCNVLNGIARPGPKVKAKLERVVRELEGPL